MENSRYLFYLTNGTVGDEPPPEGQFFVQENLGTDFYPSKFVYCGDQILMELEACCIKLYDIFQNRIFPSSDEYYGYIDSIPVGILTAGLDSNFDIPKEMFEKYFSKSVYDEALRYKERKETDTAHITKLDKQKYLFAYTSDCQSLISTLQELILATNDSFIGFYRLLCAVKPIGNDDGDYCAMTSEVRLTFNMLYSLIIQIYSIFDITTKIVYELENLKECVDKYQRLASKGILYGDKNRLQIDKRGTIFEKCRVISIFENLRNEIVHNATWEMHPKVFLRVENQVVTERAIYLPDFSEDGNLVTYMNRKRFFADGKKVNEELPRLYLEFLHRLYFTLHKIPGMMQY